MNRSDVPELFDAHCHLQVCAESSGPSAAPDRTAHAAHQSQPAPQRALGRILRIIPSDSLISSGIRSDVPGPAPRGLPGRGFLRRACGGRPPLQRAGMLRGRLGEGDHVFLAPFSPACHGNTAAVCMWALLLTLVNVPQRRGAIRSLR